MQGILFSLCVATSAALCSLSGCSSSNKSLPPIIAANSITQSAIKWEASSNANLDPSAFASLIKSEAERLNGMVSITNHPSHRLLVYFDPASSNSTTPIADAIILIDLGGKERVEHVWFTLLSGNDRGQTEGTALLTFIERKHLELTGDRVVHRKTTGKHRALTN